jgi:hypothetical protein
MEIVRNLYKVGYIILHDRRNQNKVWYLSYAVYVEKLKMYITIKCVNLSSAMPKKQGDKSSTVSKPVNLAKVS